MKKAFVYIFGIVVFYLLFAQFYRPNFLLNGRFARASANWQYTSKTAAKIVTEEGEAFPYLALSKGGEAAQFFLSALIPGTACEVSLKARTKNPPANLTFRLDEHAYAVMLVTNTTWQTFRFRFPLFDYKDQRSFRLAAGSKAVDVSDPVLRRAKPFEPIVYKELEGSFAENLLANPNFLKEEGAWEFSEECAGVFTNYRGVSVLQLNQVSNRVVKATQKVQLKKGQNYVLSCYTLLDDNRPSPRFADARITFSDPRPKVFVAKYPAQTRLGWFKGKIDFKPKEDCEAEIILQAGPSQEKKPGRALFSEIRLFAN